MKGTFSKETGEDSKIGILPTLMQKGKRRVSVKKKKEVLK